MHGYLQERCRTYFWNIFVQGSDKTLILKYADLTNLKRSKTGRLLISMITNLQQIMVKQIIQLLTVILMQLDTMLQNL